MLIHSYEYRVPVPCLCSPAELGRLYGYCRQEYTRKGSIVELGPWLGGSTLAILAGLKPEDSLVTMDSFCWEPWMDSHVAEVLPCGTSFKPRFDANINNDPRVTAVSCNFDCEDFSCIEGPVEFVMLDAAKSPASFAAVVTNLLPKMLVGGYLLDQDFRHAICMYTYQKLVYYQLREYLRPVDKVVPGWGVGFRVQKPIPRAFAVTLVDGWWHMHSVNILYDALNYFRDYGAW